MKSHWLLIVTALVSVLLVSCGQGISGNQSVPALATDAATMISLSTTETITETASETESDPTGTSVPSTEVQIFLIALEDRGASGNPVGCNDSIVAVTRQIPATEPTIEAALADLLSLKEDTYGELGLYNSLARSNLVVDSAIIENGLATVHLSGDLLLDDPCDNPRAQAQLEYTVLQFPGVEGVLILINEAPIQSVLSGQG